MRIILSPFLIPLPLRPILWEATSCLTRLKPYKYQILVFFPLLLPANPVATQTNALAPSRTIF